MLGVLRAPHPPCFTHPTRPVLPGLHPLPNGEMVTSLGQEVFDQRLHGEVLQNRLQELRASFFHDFDSDRLGGALLNKPMGSPCVISEA